MVIEVVFWIVLIMNLPQALNFEYPSLLNIQCVKEYRISNQNLSYFACESIVLARAFKAIDLISAIVFEKLKIKFLPRVLLKGYRLSPTNYKT